MLYQFVKEGLNGQPVPVPFPTNIHSHVKNPNHSWFVSLYQYDEEQIKIFRETGRLAGLRGGTTNLLFFDIDNKQNVAEAQAETVKFIHQLIEDGIPVENMEIFFSGKKGFTINVELTERITHEEFKALIKHYLKSYKIDEKILSPVQLMRIHNTKHDETKLFKIPLDPDELLDLDITKIQELAKAPRKPMKAEKIAVPAKFKEIFKAQKVAEEAKVKVQKVATTSKTDFVNKPKDWKNCKWSLLQGNYKEGERNYANMVLAATCRGLGFDKDSARALCLTSLDKSWKKHGQGGFDETELEARVLDVVFDEFWKGGQYSCKTDPFLENYCENLGEHKCSREDEKDNTIPIDSAFSMFKDYAENIDKLTIKTGINPIDARLRMTIGMLIGLVAPAGSGKTSISLQVLNTMSKKDELSLFFSLDMYHALVFQKLVQKHFGIDSDEIFAKFQEKDEDFQKRIVELLRLEYKNVEFCFDAGISVEQMTNTIKMVEQKRGQKIRFVVVDYNELVISDKADPTAASAYVIQKLREIANTFNVCVLVLLQPNKVAGNPSSEMMSYHSAKGSGAISQAVSVMLGMSRPGYDPKRPHEDKFVTINCLKNRMGNLFSIDLFWNGLRGTIREMTQEEERQLQEIRDRKAQEKKDKDDSGW